MDWAAPIIAMENPAEGIAMQRASIDLRRRAFSPRYPTVLDAEQELAVMLLRTGQTAEATALLRDVVAHMDGQYGPRHTAYAGAIGYLADALMQVGAVDSAEKLVKRAVAIRTATFGAQGAITALSSLGLARVAAARGDTAAADSIYDAARGSSCGKRRARAPTCASSIRCTRCCMSDEEKTTCRGSLATEASSEIAAGQAFLGAPCRVTTRKSALLLEGVRLHCLQGYQLPRM
jgi:hypothetical protein